MMPPLQFQTRSGVTFQADLFPSFAGCLVLQQAVFFMGIFTPEVVRACHE